MIRRTVRGGKAERGEGNARFIVYLAFLGILGYLGIRNVPVFFNVQSLKSDTAELARTTGSQGIPAERVRLRADDLARKYEIPVTDIKVQQDGKGIIITLNTVKKIDLIVTDYEWAISQTSKQQPF